MDKREDKVKSAIEVLNFVKDDLYLRSGSEICIFSGEEIDKFINDLQYAVSILE